MELGTWSLVALVVITVVVASIRFARKGNRTYGSIVIQEKNAPRARAALQVAYRQHETDEQASLAQLMRQPQLPATPSNMLSYGRLISALSATAGIVHEGDIDEALRRDDTEAFRQLESWYRRSMLPVWVGQLMNRVGVFNRTAQARHQFRSAYHEHMLSCNTASNA